MNDRQTYKEPDWDRIAHLFKLGIAASLLALIGGDMVLGWGACESLGEALVFLTAYFYWNRIIREKVDVPLMSR